MNDDAWIPILAFGLIVILIVVVAKVSANEKSGCCAYCQNTISEHADTVICTDGRRYHAECYLRYIEEGKNGKANSKKP